MDIDIFDPEIQKIVPNRDVWSSESRNYFSYTKMARRTQRLLKTKPFSAEEILLRYTQFVGENQGTLPELQNEGRNLNFVVYNNLDIWIPFVLLCLAAIYFAAFWMFKISCWILRIIEVKIVDLKCLKNKVE